MVKSARDTAVVTEIKKRFGPVIDLNKSPTAIIEILSQFGPDFNVAAGPGGSAGAPAAPPPPGKAPEVGIAAVLNLLLELKRDVRELHARIR